MEITNKPYHLVKVIKDFEQLLLSETEKTKVSVHLQMDGKLPSVLKGKEENIRKILEILLQNAIQNTKQGQIILSVWGDYNDNGLFILNLAVSDTGSGVEDDLISVEIMLLFMNGELKINRLENVGTLVRVKIPQEIENKTPISRRKKQKNSKIKERVSKQEENNNAKTENHIQTVETEAISAEIAKEQTKKRYVDTALGISYCANSEEMYLEIVKEYYGQSKQYLDELFDSFFAKDWSRYAIKAHALKSTSMTIGAKEFSEVAKQHEFAAKEENVAFLEKEFQAFMSGYQEILAELKQCYPVLETLCEPSNQALEEIEQSAGENKAGITKEEYQKQCEQLLAAIQKEDVMEAMMTVDTLTQTVIVNEGLEEQKKRIDTLVHIFELINSTEYQVAQDILQEMFI